jgi:hypothetical protein
MKKPQWKYPFLYNRLLQFFREAVDLKGGPPGDIKILRAYDDIAANLDRTISPADWTWQRPTQDGQATWFPLPVGWAMLPFGYRKNQEKPESAYVLASHPQGLPPPDGFRLED